MQESIMKDHFQKILDVYLSDGIGKVDKEQESYKLVVKQVPQIISEILSNTQYEVKGSVGRGTRTTCPWISILDTNITKSTQEGLYLVYLFKKDMSGFYLS